MTGAPEVEIEVTVRPTLTYAMAHAGVPLIEAVRVIHRGAAVGASCLTQVDKRKLDNEVGGAPSYRDRTCSVRLPRRSVR